MIGHNEYYHLTVNGKPMCASRYTSTDLQIQVACEHYSAEEAENARKKLAQQLPKDIVAVVSRRCPQPKVTWD
jgi:hypothetical protein